MDMKTNAAIVQEFRGKTDPSSEDLIDPLFNAVWDAIKKWDISREPSERRLYAGATGTDVMTILNAVRPFLNAKDELVREAYERGKKDAVDYINKRISNDIPNERARTVPTTQEAVQKEINRQVGIFVRFLKDILVAARTSEIPPN